MAAKVKIRQKLGERLHEKTKDMGKWLGSVVRDISGIMRYHETRND
jgi:hypothetical protein